MNNKNLIIIGLIAVFGIAGVLLFINLLSGGASQTNSNAPTNPSATIVNTVTAQTTGSSTSSTGYKDGKYSASVTYNHPEGTENMTVNLTLKDGVVTAVSDTFNPTERESRENQQSFESVISSKVVGKKLDELSLSRVGGASLTTGGFNKALELIKQKAKA